MRRWPSSSSSGEKEGPREGKRNENSGPLRRSEKKKTKLRKEDKRMEGGYRKGGTLRRREGEGLVCKTFALVFSCTRKERKKSGSRSGGSGDQGRTPAEVLRTHP